MTERSYKHPAIIEAVFELRLQTVKSWGISSFVEFAKLAKEHGFPNLKDAAESFQVTFPIGSIEAPTMTPVPSRVQTWNEEGTQLWQASPQMYAANRRAPYAGWAQFLPHILEGLELYCRTAMPEQAEALKLQYVNRIEVDVQQSKPSDFVTFLTPEIQYADTVNNFVCRTEQLFADGDQIAVTSARDLAAASGIAVILEILYTATKPNLEQSALLSVIEKAHSRTLLAFEKSITDALRERMELK